MRAHLSQVSWGWLTVESFLPAAELRPAAVHEGQRRWAGVLQLERRPGGFPPSGRRRGEVAPAAAAGTKHAEDLPGIMWPGVWAELNNIRWHSVGLSTTLFLSEISRLFFLLFFLRIWCRSAFFFHRLWGYMQTTLIFSSLSSTLQTAWIFSGLSSENEIRPRRVSGE